MKDELFNTLGTKNKLIKVQETFGKIRKQNS